MSLWEYLGNANQASTAKAHTNVLSRKKTYVMLLWQASQAPAASALSPCSLHLSISHVSFKILTCLCAVLGGENVGYHVYLQYLESEWSV